MPVRLEQHASAGVADDVRATLQWCREVYLAEEQSHAVVPWIYVGGEQGERELVRRGFSVSRGYERHRGMRVLCLRIKVRPWPTRDIVFHELVE